MKVKPLALGYAGAILSAVCMLLLSIINSFGFFVEATAHMQDMHIFYTPTVLGTILGMIEAAVFSFVVLYVFGWLHNKFAK